MNALDNVPIILTHQSNAISIAGSKGTQACINAANTVSGIIGDLDTTILFATSGSLHPAGAHPGDFTTHR